MSAVHIENVCAVLCMAGPVRCLPPGRRVAAAAAHGRGRGAGERRRPLGRGCCVGCGGLRLPRYHPGNARCVLCARVPGEWVSSPAPRRCGQGGRHKHEARELMSGCSSSSLAHRLASPPAALSSLFTVAGGGFAPSFILWGQDAPAAHAAGAGCARRCWYSS